MKSRNGDYHLLVAQNFLSNISLDGSHMDTRLRMFDRQGFVAMRGLPSSIRPSSINSSHLFPPDARVPITDSDDASVSMECENVDDVPLLEREISSPNAAGRIGSPSISFFSGLSARKCKTSKKPSMLQRFVRMVSNDDSRIEGKQKATNVSLSTLAESGHNRKSVGSERSLEEPPISPVSGTQLTLLRRLKASLAKGDRSRSYLCSSSGAAAVTVTHFPFQASARDRSRLRQSRSSFGSSDRLHLSYTDCRVEELRPFDFKELEYVRFDQLGSKLRRSSLSLCGVAWKSASREERRTSELASNPTCSPPTLGSLSRHDTGQSRDEGINEDSPQFHFVNSQRNDYDPSILDDILSATRTVVRCQGFIGVTKLFLPAQVAKTTLNDIFAEKFPYIHLTYSKFMSIKRDIWKIAQECDIDDCTIAHTFVFFERIVLKGLISKHNRKFVAGIALLVAVKLNDYKKPVIVKVLECAEELLRIPRREMLSFELPLCAALDFDLFPPIHHVELHLQKLIFGVV